MFPGKICWPKAICESLAFETPTSIEFTWLVVSNLFFLHFHPNPQKNDPIWRLRKFFRWVGEKSAPTSIETFMSNICVCFAIIHAPGDSSRDLFIPDRWRSPTTLKRVTWTHHPQKGHGLNHQAEGEFPALPNLPTFFNLPTWRIIPVSK